LRLRVQPSTPPKKQKKILFFFYIPPPLFVSLSLSFCSFLSDLKYQAVICDGTEKPGQVRTKDGQ
jgi:hypothetical protein